MKAAVCFLAILTAAASADTLPEPPPTPDFGKACVTIPYAELRALWEAGQPKAKPPEPPEPAPVPYLVHRADVRIVLGESASNIDADFEVESLDKKWQHIPLLGGDARLDKADAGERSLVWENGYELLTNVPGRTPVAMHLITRGIGQLRTPLKLKFGIASVFSYSFFFDGLTGITITVGAIVTLALLMAFTARVKWDTAFGSRPVPPPPIPSTAA